MARGHVRKRGASYQAIVYAGIDPVTKRQRYLRQTAHTPKEAERALTRLLGQVDEQRTPTPAPPSATCWTAGSSWPSSS
jgi:integrase